MIKPLTSHPDEIKSMGSPEELKIFMYQIVSNMGQIHNFEIEDDVKELFFNTDFNNNEVHLPFKVIKFDCSYYDKEVDIWYEEIYARETPKGINLMFLRHGKNENSNLYAVGDLSVDSCLRVHSDREINRDFSKSKNWLSEKEAEASENRMLTFVGNCLNYINSKDIEIVTIDRLKDNPNYIWKKLRDKKVPKALVHKVKLIGKYRRYIDSLKSQGKFDFDYSFWVRGHWRELRSQMYVNKVGQTIWIYPYIKGEGELIKTEYNLTQEAYWKNQGIMISLLKDLFIDVRKNDRIVLDGYEIDGWIPSTKVGFEYNGIQHFEFTPAFHETEEDFLQQVERDKKKREIAASKGILIIDIDYDEELSRELIINKLKQHGRGI
jgi:hypothetical protein